MTPLHGLLLVDKPSGPSSHDVVAAARRVYRTRRVGHAGTLDPMASGLLLLLVGEATKLSSYLTLETKSYSATIALGRSTDTLDALGETTQQTAPTALSPIAVEHALALERQRHAQIPPSFSAISVAGERAYAAARAGRALELPARPVTVHSLELRALTRDQLELSLRVSKGYYVRALARDLCATLEVAGHLAALRRTASGPFELSDAAGWPLSEPRALLSVEHAAQSCLPVAQLSGAGAQRAALGQRLGAEHFLTPPPSGVSAWLSPEGRLLALGEPRDAGFRVLRGFPPTP